MQIRRNSRLLLSFPRCFLSLFARFPVPFDPAAHLFFSPLGPGAILQTQPTRRRERVLAYVTLFPASPRDLITATIFGFHKTFHSLSPVYFYSERRSLFIFHPVLPRQRPRPFGSPARPRNLNGGNPLTGVRAHNAASSLCLRVNIFHLSRATRREEVADASAFNWPNSFEPRLIGEIVLFRWYL